MQANLVYVEKKGLPSAILNRLLRLAAFQNPEFYKAQKMRLSTTGSQGSLRVVKMPSMSRCCAVVSRRQSRCLRPTGSAPEVRDERSAGTPIEVEFKGELRPLQVEAVSGLFSMTKGSFAHRRLSERLLLLHA